MTNDLKGLIFDIQRCSTHDGPGIRTTVFFKGCPLCCPWCHNPESISSQPELMFWKKHCIGCLRCISECPHGAWHKSDKQPVINRNLCTGCGICVEVCPSNAINLAGRWMDAQTLMREIERDKVFYKKSGGGVTFSGGESLMQHGFVLEMLKLCKSAGLHTAVDTCGEVPWKNIFEVIEFTDLFLYDIKPFDTKFALDNFIKLAKTNANIQVRIPMISGKNDNSEYVADIIDIIRGHDVCLLPFHKLGIGKYAALGVPGPSENFERPSDESISAIAQTLRNEGCTVEIH